MSPRMHHHRFESSLRARTRSSLRSAFWVARDPLAAGALLAASALLATGCNAPVAPIFELTFEGSGIASCDGSAAEDVRLMCDSTVRVRILDPNGIRDRVPSVCQEISSLEIGTMEALSDLDIDLKDLPLGPAMIQVEVWRRDWINSADCSIIAEPDPIVVDPGDELDQGAPPPPVVSQPAVIGRAWFEIGRDEHVRIPLTCPDIGQVNRFAEGCGLDVEISDLDQGVLLRQELDRPEPNRPDEGGPTHVAGAEPASPIDLEALRVQYVLVEQAPTGDWEPGAREWMTIDVRDDGSAVWRAWPSFQFWQSFNRSRTVCIEVGDTASDGIPTWPQVSCFQVGSETSQRRRLQASYLPPEDLECLLAAAGDGSMPAEGIVIGRVVEAEAPASDELRPAANVQVLPTPADLPREPIPRLAPIGGDGNETDDGMEDLDVQYVSKESEPTSPATPACHVDDATATTPSGYFLSDASFPAHWQIATEATALPPGEDGEQNGTAGTAPTITGTQPGRILVGGRIRNKVNIVRIELQ
jgi:hypothetical protein